MSQFLVIYLSFILAMICEVYSTTTKTSVCSTERFQLRAAVTTAYQELEKTSKKEMPNFYNKGLTCRNYIDGQSPFPTAVLKKPLNNFLGSKFLEQKYEVFWPFVDAMMVNLNGTTSAPSKSPGFQLWNVYSYATQLITCVFRNTASAKKIAVKYDVTLHTNDVKQCLTKAGIRASRKRVEIVKYTEIFEELYQALDDFGSIASTIKFLGLK